MRRSALSAGLLAGAAALVLASATAGNARGPSPGGPIPEATPVPAGGDPFAGLRSARPLRDLAPAGVDSALIRLHRLFPDPSDRLYALCLLTLGTPYQGGCLGEDREPDTDPLFRLDRTDCTVQVLVLASLLHAHSLEEARRAMLLANYRSRGGKREPRYETRLHFSVDRLATSPLFADVTAEVCEPASLVEVELTLNRASDGSRLVPVAWQRPVRVRYLPARSVTDGLLDGLPRGLGVILVRESNFERGLAASHEGVLFGHELFHASSVEGEAVRVKDFREYLFPGGEHSAPRFDGVVFYRFRPGKPIRGRP
jgi:hypothetical protein